MSTVLLFRTPSPASEEPDRFVSALEAYSYHAVSVPVLEHALVNVEHLKTVIRHGPVGRYSGVIVTSGRASEGWRDAAEALSSDASAISEYQSLPLQRSCLILDVSVRHILATNPLLRRRR